MKRLLCFLGWHQWTASIQDYIDEFGYVPFDNRKPQNCKCSVCGIKYK